MTHKHILLQLNDGISDTTSEVVNEVKILQQSLKDWGTLAANESVDGQFGPKTDKAVKLFQEKHSLTQDGKVGQKTWAELLKVSPSEVVIIPRSPVDDGPGNGKSPFSGNKGMVHNELIRHGFSTVQCAAILGCVQQESSFNPHAIEQGPPHQGLGLFQWSFDRKKGMPPITNSVATDIHNQVNHFVHELETAEKKAGKTLRSATNLAQAMEGMKEFERFGIAGNREKFAKQILDELT